MDPINILALLNLIATFGANISGTGKRLKNTVIVSKEKPVTYLQKLPIVLSTITLILFILALFQVGTFNYDPGNQSIRIAGLIVYLVFSWVQIWAFKKLGDNYSQEVLIQRNHQLVNRGPYRFIRHPQYLSQVLMDLGAGIATLSFLVTPFALIQIPFLILRALLEEKLLEKNFKERFLQYKSKSGFMLPFIG